MPINFPNSPSDGATHSDGVTQWEYSSANHAWTVTNSSPVSLENATDFDTTVVYLERSGSQNLLNPATGLKYNLTNKTLSITGNVSQTTNYLEIKNSGGTVLNSFNQRGVLTSAGRIYYTGTTPAPNASDTGLLWYNTTDGNLYIWNGTTWTITSGGLDLTSNQTVSGAKTFSTNIFLSSTATLSGQGASKTLVFKPTNSGSTATTALTLSDTEATFAVPVEFSELGTTAKTVVVTTDTDQTISGTKTFGGIVYVDSSIACSSGTDGGEASNDLRLRCNMSADGRYIKIFNNANVINGIVIRAKNKDNLGGLSVEGNTSITGNLTVSGSFTTTSLVAASTVYGQIRSNSGSSAWNVNVNPDSLGNLTFTSTTAGSDASKGITVQNTSTTQTVKIYVRKERSGAELAVSIHKITLPPSTSLFVPATSAPVTTGSVTVSYYGGAENTTFNFGVANSPIRYQFSIAP